MSGAGPQRHRQNAQTALSVCFFKPVFSLLFVILFRLLQTVSDLSTVCAFFHDCWSRLRRNICPLLINWSNIELIWFQKALVTSHSWLFSGTKGNTYPRLMLGNYAPQLSSNPRLSLHATFDFQKTKALNLQRHGAAPPRIQSRTKWAETFAFMMSTPILPMLGIM